MRSPCGVAVSSILSDICKYLSGKRVVKSKRWVLAEKVSTKKSSLLVEPLIKRGMDGDQEGLAK